MDFGVRTKRRMLRRALGAAVTLIVGVAVAGCTTPAPKPSPTPTAIFSSEEEALAAATDTFAEYLAAYDSALAAGGDDLSAVRGYVSDSYFAELSVPDTLSANGWHTDGTSSFETKGVESFENSRVRTDIVIQVCRDVSDVRFRDQAGTDVTPAERPEIVPLLVAFASEKEGSPSLIIRGVGSWGDSSCAVP
jgi:hypothetical protein